jgi:acid phosphatase type 7
MTINIEEKRVSNSRAKKPFIYAGCVLLACVAAILIASPVLGRSSAVTLVGAGDIADCGIKADSATAKLLGNIPGTVYTLGDNVYDHGTREEFRNCYDPTWGKYKKRTKPTAGNHDYETAAAKPYYDYFGARAGSPRRGYYSYDRGAWHIVALNSNCAEVGGCETNSPQGEWLRNDLARSDANCTLAYFHHPLFSSGQNTTTTAVRPFWEILYNRDAEVILVGHAHSYERFAPQTPGGNKNLENGIRQFVVGTGGKPAINPFDGTAKNSQRKNDKTPGVLKLTLKPNSYDWKFVPIAGKEFRDSGSDGCH